MSQEPQMQKPPVSTLAVVGLVFTVLCCQPIGLILSIIALVRINASGGKLGGQVLAIIALALTVPLIGVQAAIAIPNFVKFQCRSKQSEAKAELRSLFASEQSYKIEKGAFSTDTAAIGFSALGAHRYQVTILDANAASFHAQASGIAEMAGDIWTIDESGQPQAKHDLCTDGR